MAGRRNKPRTAPAYNAALADKICTTLANSTAGLHALCKRRGMPRYATVQEWLMTHTDFMDKYRQAREAQAALLVEQILDIVDNCTNDEQLAKVKLRVDTRKWLAAHLAPATWGDKGTDTIFNPMAKKPDWLTMRFDDDSEP